MTLLTLFDERVTCSGFAGCRGFGQLRRAPVTENKPTKDTKPTYQLAVRGARNSLQGGFGGYGGFVSPYGGVTRRTRQEGRRQW